MPHANTITVGVSRTTATEIAGWASLGPPFVVGPYCPEKVRPTLVQLYRHDNEWIRLLALKMAKRAVAKRNSGNIEVPRGMVIAFARAAEAGLLPLHLREVASAWFSKAHSRRGRKSLDRQGLELRSSNKYALEERHQRRIRKRKRDVDGYLKEARALLDEHGIMRRLRKTP